MPATKVRKSARVAHSNGNGQNGNGSFDVSSRYAAEEVDIQIMDTLVDATKPTGGIWTIAPPFSALARAAEFKRVMPRVGENGEVTGENVGDRDEWVERLAAVTVRWNFTIGNVPLACTPENARALLTETRTAWMFQQLFLAYVKMQSFFDSAKPS